MFNENLKELRKSKEDMDSCGYYLTYTSSINIVSTDSRTNLSVQYS